MFHSCELYHSAFVVCVSEGQSAIEMTLDCRSGLRHVGGSLGVANARALAFVSRLTAGSSSYGSRPAIRGLFPLAVRLDAAFAVGLL
jgi:hypothetical protein